jgi:thiol:disulfide interchange protein
LAKKILVILITISLVIGLFMAISCELVRKPAIKTPAPKTEVGGDAWIMNDLEEGKRLAKSESKLVLVYFWAVWCTLCVKMDEETWPDPKVRQLIKKYYVPVKIDADEEPKLLDEFNVAGLPTIVILDKNGRQIDIAVGFLDANELAKMLEDNARK